jgi:hypothetical protein
MSSYLKKKALGVTETIKIRPRQNPIFLILRWIWGILGCWLFLVPLIKAIAATIRFTHTEYLVTNKHVMEKHNVFNTYTAQIALNEIKHIAVIYTFWGKIFNYGNIVFSSSGSLSVSFICIKNAERIKKQINSML